MRTTVRPFQPARAGVTVLAMTVFLAGCEGLGLAPAGSSPNRPAPTGGAVSVNRDVERPDVFSVSENALWDGRPSLGGVWVAYPKNMDPERVIIRNVSNGKSVIGALFRRERDNPGPAIQLSSDAAVALGVLAGTPTEISIVVLRREAVEVDVPEVAMPESDPNMTRPARRGARVAGPSPSAPPPAPTPAAAPETDAANLAAIVEQTLSDVPAASTTVPAAAPVAASPQPLFPVKKPYIQIGTFSEESNALELVTTLADAGVQAQVQANNPENPTLWRVVSGPYTRRSERSAQLRIIKGLGFVDAFTFK